MTIAEAARRESTWHTSVAKWRDQFRPKEGARHGPAGREQALAAEIEQLTCALGEAHLTRTEREVA